MEKNKENYEYPEQKIVEVGMENEVKTSFLEYSMSVIVSRAIPDVRDGLKPVHRRILYAMYEDHLTYQNAFRKSATTVGNVLGRYHPHGDSSVYDAMVRLAQPFSLRYPLIEGHGNFGNIDGDGAAAYRYTEARMSRMADDMLTDIKKDVVDFVPNFDNKHPEPSVLPSRFPNLLVNGSMGIAVGMATNIPPHNLGEVVDGIVMLMDDPEVTLAKLMTAVKGPDFPTYATICGTAGIVEAYTTGKGRISVRAKAEVEEEHHRIIVTEIPYAVNKAEMVEGMANCVKDKRIEGITALRDESGKDGLRIVIEYRRDANGSVILNQLYKYTQLQSTFAVNMLTLVPENGKLVPKVLGLKAALEYYVKHQEEVVERRVRYDLKAALDEAHIFEGYKIAIDNIDEVIAIIRSSASIPDAKARLIERFALSDPQAQAIVDMTLGKLSGMERRKVEEHLAALYSQIEEFRAILADEGKIREIIKGDLLELKRKYGDERRTVIEASEDDIVDEDLIERHNVVITMSHAGYIKRRPSDSYSAQRRGGKGIIGMATKSEDYVEYVTSADSHSYLLMFTNTGRMFTRKSYQIPEAPRTSKGTNIVNILDLEAGEKLTAMLAVSDFEESYLTMVTRQGMLKRTPISEYAYQTRIGKKAIKLSDGDELLFVARTTGEDKLLIATSDGRAVFCSEDECRPSGRDTYGVIGVKLSDGCYVAGAAVVTPEDESGGCSKLLFITDGGYGKRCEFGVFPVHGRGTKGVICNDSDKHGVLAGVETVSDDDDIMIITDDGTLIRTPVSGISVYNRTAGGVIVMRPSEGAKIVNFTKVCADDEDSDAESDAQ